MAIGMVVAITALIFSYAFPTVHTTITTSVKCSSSNVADAAMIFHLRANTLEWTACTLPALFAFGTGADSLLQRILVAFPLLKTKTERTKLFSDSIMQGEPAEGGMKNV
jgi:hypothetical protein